MLRHEISEVMAYNEYVVVFGIPIFKYTYRYDVLVLVDWGLLTLMYVVALFAKS
jgi:hypothetical protein